MLRKLKFCDKNYAFLAESNIRMVIEKIWNIGENNSNYMVFDCY